MVLLGDMPHSAAEALAAQPAMGKFWWIAWWLTPALQGLYIINVLGASPEAHFKEGMLAGVEGAVDEGQIL